MKRFLIDNELKMYYPSYKVAELAHPSSKIVEITEEEPFVNLIPKIIENSTLLQTLSKSNDVRFLYETTIAGEKCLFWLSVDSFDSKHYDFVKYQIQRKGQLIKSITWDISDIETFYNDVFCVREMEYEIISLYKKAGCKERLPKPKELKGVKQIGSAKFLKVSCPVFIVDGDLFIKHNDYFSPSLETPEDIGTPLSYRADKYIGKKVTEKFVYNDSWGDIVLKRVAWIKFSNFKSFIKNHEEYGTVQTCLNLIKKYHRFDDDLDVEWDNLFRQIYKITKENINEV